MNNKNLKINATLCLAVLLAVGVSAPTQANEQGSQRTSAERDKIQKEKGHQKQRKGDRTKIFEGLNLTPEQMQAVKEIRKANREKMKSARENAKKSREALMEGQDNNAS